MRKYILLSGVAAIAISGSGATKYLYRQNFDNVTTVAETGWTFRGPSITIESDENGKYIQLSSETELRKSGGVTWGSEIFMKDGESVLEDGTYFLKYDFRIAKAPETVYNPYASSMTIFTNKEPNTYRNYRIPSDVDGSSDTYWQNYVSDLSQVPFHGYQYSVNGPTIESDGLYAIDDSDAVTFEQNKWYTAETIVNTETRNVIYTVLNIEDNITVKEGTFHVPETNINGEPIDMYAAGLYVYIGTLSTVLDFDNILISCQATQDPANTPEVFLSRIGQTADGEINLNLRAYTVSFKEGEILHIIGTAGETAEVQYADCNGEYTYETDKNGTMKSWTTIGDSTSDIVETEIDCTPIVLPAAKATLMQINEGFNKIYTLTVDNAGVPLSPDILIDWEYDNGSSHMYNKNQVSGTQAFALGGSGYLVVTTHAPGYESNVLIIDNTKKAEIKNVWDFARMTEDQIKEIGFPEFQILNSNYRQGFESWTARKRLYYQLEGSEHENEQGEMIRDLCYPFGFISEDNETNVIKYSVIDRSNVAYTYSGEYFDGLTIFPDTRGLGVGYVPNVGMIHRIGLFNDQVINKYNYVNVNDLESTDIVVVNTIASYGATSNHPICANDEEYFAQLAGEDNIYMVESDGIVNPESGLYVLQYPLYRIDTAITKITVFKQVFEESGVEAINSVAKDDNWYSIDGVRVSEPTRPGLYIHNGKKIIVK